MKKMNLYFSFKRFCVVMILAMLAQVQMNAQSCPLSCIDNINISITEAAAGAVVGSPCETTIAPELLLSVGGFNDLQACLAAAGGGFTVQTQAMRFGTFVPAIGAGNATVSGADVGRSVRIRVSVVNAAGVIVNSCWGTVNVEDKQAPRITCPADVTLFCSQLSAQATPALTVTGDLGLDGVRPTAIGAVDGTAFDCTMLMAADQMFTDFSFDAQCAAPFATAAGPGVTAVPTDVQIEARGIAKADATALAARISAGVSTGINAGEIIRVIIRCFRATDHYGNASAPCCQVIFVTRATAILCPTAELTFNCSGPAPAACGIAAAPADLSPTGLTVAGFRGWPVLDVNRNGVIDAGIDLVLDPNAPNSCNVAVTFTDEVTVVCQGSRKIFRTFTIRNWCTGVTSTCTQVIRVLDFNAPIVTAEFLTFGSPASTICVIDQWGVQRNQTVFNNDGARSNTATFDGSFIQCGPGVTVPGTVTELFALADANRCGLFFTRFTITACDPLCTNGLVEVQVNTSKLTRRLVRTFVDAKGIINYVYEFSGFLSDDDGNGFEDITYTASDLCGYAQARKTFRVRTIDNAKPQVVCITSHTASVGTDGSVRIFASTFNNGSTDNCGIDRVLVRRMDGRRCQANNDGCGTLVADSDCYRDYVEFGCCDVGTTLQVELLIIDQLGNFNSCMVTVTVQNKDVPVCIAPPAVTIPCTNIERIVADPVGFGRLGTASAFSNCGYTLAEIAPITTFEACFPAGRNFFTRRFEVRNCNGAVVSSCSQRVTVTLTSDFTVDFPDDVVVACLASIPSKDALKAQMLDPASWNVTAVNPATGRARGDGAILNNGCGVIAVEIKDDTLMATNNLECMKILRKIRVIDWCKYNPNNDAVDQDANCYGDPVCGDIHANGTVGSASASARANNLAAWQNLDPFRLEICSTRAPGTPAGVDAPTSLTSRDITHFDRRFRDADGLGGPSNDPTNPTQPNSFSDGIICFTQIIKVIDTVAPVATVVPNRIVCNTKTLCVGNYTETLTASDLCAPGDLSSTTTTGLRFFWSLLSGDVTKNPTATNVIAQGSTASIVANNLALGVYTIRWSVRDLCGNTSALQSYTVTVRDCDAPTILTHDKNAELSFVLGGVNTGMVQVCAAQVLNGVSDNCTPEAKLLANLRFQRASEPAVYPVGGGVCLMFTCADLTGVNPVPVRVWTRDDAGLDNFVITYITVQDNRGACTVNPLASISGTLKTENNISVNNVSVSASTNGTIVGNGSSSATGEFNLTAPLDQNVQVKAVKIATEDKYAGVTTFDIARISKHLLDIEKLTSAYSIIAADVDKSGEVDATDMLLIRNFILRKSSSLPGGIWRFIDKAYSFTNPTNPFGEDFPEVVNFTKIPSAAAANFVAVKLGDVNTTYVSNFAGVQVRGNNALTLQAEDMTLVAGNEYTVNITADNFNASAFQGTFSLNGATVKSVKAGDLANYNDGNFGVFANDITTSWNGVSKLNAQVLSITFVANKAAKLSEVLSIGSGLTQAVANDVNGNEMNVNLKFTSGKVSGGEFALYQNTPNPVSVETKIGFNLPAQSTAKVTIYNMEGKVMMVKKGEFKAGYNEIYINKSDLNANGVMYYRLETPEHTATKKMIIIE